MPTRSSRIVTHFALEDAELPRRMFGIYLACAVLSVPVFTRNVFELAPAVWPRVVIGHALPFFLLPSAVHALYRTVMPRLLRHVTSAPARIALHLALPTLTALVVGTVIVRLHDALGWSHAPPSGMLATNVLMTFAFLVPEKLVVGLRRLAARNELYAIQSRAHPHFLFNAINAVAALISEDAVRAEDALLRFAEVLRQYLEIQKIRFEQLTYRIDIEGGLEHLETPPLVLLPLVENAVLHGVASSDLRGEVHVQVSREGRAVVLDVADDGPGPGGSPRTGSGTALRDLTRRLELVYGEAASLVVGKSGGRGYVATLRLPAEGPAR